MMTPIPESALGNTDGTAEHIAAQVGLKGLLGGETGANYTPKSSPFAHIARQALKEPEEANVNAFKEITKMKKQSLDDIEQGAQHIFGEDSAPDHKPETTKDLHELYDITNGLSESSELLVNHMTNQTAPISDHMPETSAGLSQIAGSAMAALHDHKPNLAPTAALDMEKKPSHLDIAKFNGVSGLLDKPLSVFPRVKNGSISTKDVALLNQVYPNLMTDIKTSAMKNLIDHKAQEKGPIPYSTRLGLSTLFGENLDSSLNHLASNQMALSSIGVANAAQNAQQGQGARPSKTGMGKMKIGTRDQTSAQQTLERPRK